MSLSTKIILTLSVLVVLTAATSAGLIFNRLNEQLIDAKMDELERETQLQAALFSNRIDELLRDVLLLAGTPPIQGIARATAAGGVDPVDGSSTEAWRGRLNVIFRQTLHSKSAYLQVRYIGAADRGRALVRVHRDRPGSSIQIVEPANLQPKADRDYFRETAARAPGRIYLSDINLNRELGVVEKPKLPVIRASVPVHFEGAFYGMVVINLAIAPTFEYLATIGNRSHVLYLTNAKGEYLRHPDSSLSFAFETGGTHTVFSDFPTVAHVLDGSVESVSLLSDTGETLLSSRVIPFGPDDLGHQLGLFVSDGIADATDVAAQVARQVGLLLLILVALAIVLGIWLSRLAVGPIVRLSDAVENLDQNNPELVLPSSLSGEAKQLGQALADTLEMLRQRNQELEASNRELKQFSYIASHDLQEPIRTVTSFATNIERDYAQLMDDTGRRSLQFILESCYRMQALIHGLLEFSRLGVEARPERVELESLVRGAEADLADAISSAAGKVHVGSLPTLTVYAVELRMLFQNLIANAIKFRRDEVPPIVWVAARREGDGWLITVADNGIGVPEKHREKVFLIFQRLHNRSEYEGTGIGLAHCRKVVDMHHGRIWVETSDAGGARFCVFLKEVRA